MHTKDTTRRSRKIGTTRRFTADTITPEAILALRMECYRAAQSLGSLWDIVQYGGIAPDRAATATNEIMDRILRAAKGGPA
jgi:hypothetical protein